MQPRAYQNPQPLPAVRRLRVVYGVLLVVAAIFLVRAFYLQIIRHNHYRTAALSSQLKEYEIPAERGVIEAHNGDQLTPIVLNQKLFTLFADPKYIKDSEDAAEKVAAVIGGNASEYKEKMEADSRYAVLAKKLSREQKEQLDKLEIKGLGTREMSYRTYPQGSLGASLLGFVNDEGEGKYGLEQALDKELRGLPGQLKAITDARGVPLVANKDNIIQEPVAGKRVVTTLDIAMQKQLEDALRNGLERARAKSGDAIIMDPQTGAIKAMATYPTYNPAEFFNVEDAAVFTNSAVSAPLEIGSTMKPLTAAAALDQGVVNRDTSYYDPARYKIDGYEITNIEEDGGPGQRNVADILQLSLNTGATWLLMQMGGGEVNQRARNTWHTYMTDHFRFGKNTGIEQGYEAPGMIPDPNEGYGLNLQYANTSFGQGMTATPLQLASALSSVVNGGTYYKPHLVEGFREGGEIKKRDPEVMRNGVVNPAAARTVTELMEYTFSKNHVTYGMPNRPSQYLIGGKTGTAEIAKPGGGYYEDKFNGTFMGFVGGNQAQYVIVVRVDQPGIPGYAGSKAAAPIFSDIATMLIHNFEVVPKQ